MKDVSTDKIIAVGLIVACNLYAASSIILSAPPSGELLGTLFGGIIGALGRWAPTVKNEEATANQNQHPPDKEGGKLINAAGDIKHLGERKTKKLTGKENNENEGIS